MGTDLEQTQSGRDGLPPANWMRSATPTDFSFAKLPRLPQRRDRPAFSEFEHSPARIREPSQAPLKLRGYSQYQGLVLMYLTYQSWKAARMAARAASVHWPSARKFPVRIVDISDHTAGHD
jgi:hypothetical protein